MKTKMDKKTTGAWVVHHSHKLSRVAGPTQDYDEVTFAGKCGILLNALAQSKEVELDNSTVAALASANAISVRLELPPILSELERQRLIDRAEKAISVLGLTSRQTLEHTATIFAEASPSPVEEAAISLSEKVSELPLIKETAAEYIADSFHLSKKETQDVLSQYEIIGFVDSEKMSDRTLYFNGNLFRRDDMRKISGVVASLSSEDERKVTEVSTRLSASACIPKAEAVSVLGGHLYSKLCAIGFVDENAIGNESGTFAFVTRPAAFAKFTNSLADDAFDLAKVFVTSLTYGMTISPTGRGRITMIEALMRRLIAGNEVGPATAIGQDYKVLEMRGVIKVRPLGDGRFFMRLLKKDVGELALRVITEGETSTESLLQLPSVSATRYDGPEHNRVLARKVQTPPLRKGVAQLLENLRTGSLR